MLLILNFWCSISNIFKPKHGRKIHSWFGHWIARNSPRPNSWFIVTLYGSYFLKCNTTGCTGNLLAKSPNLAQTIMKVDDIRRKQTTSSGFHSAGPPSSVLWPPICRLQSIREITFKCAIDLDRIVSGECFDFGLKKKQIKCMNHKPQQVLNFVF